MIKLYADGADMEGIKKAAADLEISGFTTNPTLMKQAGITDYEGFAKEAIEYLKTNRPETCLSLEVFADEPAEILRQARLIDSWGKDADYSVYVKIPVMHTDGNSTAPIINQLSNEGIKLNVTAVFTFEQVKEIVDALSDVTPAIISIFAGRINDAGYDALSIFDDSFFYNKKENIEFLWASSRQAYSYIEAESSNVDIITMTPDLIKKVKGFGKDLTLFSKETCQMFFNDAAASGFKL